MPFVFAAQLLAVALLFVVPESIALIVMFVLAAAVEEFAKSIHVYAGFARSRFEPTIRVAAILGALSGLGFSSAKRSPTSVSSWDSRISRSASPRSARNSVPTCRSSSCSLSFSLRWLSTW